MSLRWHIAFWLGLVALMIAALYFLGGVLTPFVGGFALAYLLDPVADRLERLGLSRLGATSVILAFFLIVVAALFFLVAPALARQLTDFVQSLPTLVDRLTSLAIDQGNALIRNFGGGLLEKLGVSRDIASGNLDQWIAGLVSQSGAWLAGLLGSVLLGSHTLINIFSVVLVTPVVAFYMLLDWDKMIAAIDSWLPFEDRSDVHMLARDIDIAIAGFVRGQSLVCLFLGIWYSVGLTALGLNFGLLIGISAGVLSLIPYVGSLSALVISAAVAIVQGWPSLELLASTLTLVIVGQFLEGNVLSPRLVGASVGLHPVWIMFALFAFSTLFGFPGLIVAVPVSAAGGVLMRFALKRYLRSSLHQGPMLGRDAVSEDLPASVSLPAPRQQRTAL